MRLVFLIIILWLAQAPTTWAESEIKDGSAISDEETESYLMDMLQLAFNAMNVSIKPQIILIKDSEINAAATFGGLVFVNTGLIVECTHAGMLFGVLLHETGHVAGGHLARMDAAIQQAMVPAIASTLIGGAITLATGNPAGLIAGAAGGTQMLERGFKKHTRGEEENADNAALNILGNKSIWMVEMLRMLDRKSGTSIDLYLSTHPLTPDRIATAKQYAESHKDTPCKINFPADFESRFNLIRKKIIAFTKKVEMLSQEFPESDKSQPNKYGRSIYLYRLGKVDQALSLLKDLTSESPENPYFIELSGFIEFKQGKIEDSINNYRKALEKRPNSASLKVELSKSYIESKNNSNENLKLAVQYLTQSLDRNPENIFAWRLLSIAYGKQNQIPEAAACLAQEAMLTGDFKFAKTKATQGAKSVNVSLAKKSQDILEQINDDKDLKDKSR